jgi:hypothetical protein
VEDGSQVCGLWQAHATQWFRDFAWVFSVLLQRDLHLVPPHRASYTEEEEETMHATTLLQQQFQHLHTYFHALADDLTTAEWTSRALPETNLLGFTFWHIARTQDQVVHTFIRGVPSVVTAEPWVSRGGLTTPGIGVGSTLAEADQLACSIRHTDVIDYADAVHQAIQRWLSTLTDADLDTLPDLLAHIEQAVVLDQHPILQETAHDWTGRPTWRMLTGTCLAHPREHLAELDLLKRLLRGQVRGDE